MNQNNDLKDFKNLEIFFKQDKNEEQNDSIFSTSNTDDDLFQHFKSKLNMNDDQTLPVSNFDEQNKMPLSKTNQNFNSLALFEALPITNEVIEKDYPYLRKVFHLIFENPDFFNYAFFEAVGIHYSEQNATNLKAILYNLIIRQLSADGYSIIAELLQQNLSEEIKNNVSVRFVDQSPSNALQILLNIMCSFENKSLNDKSFSNFFNWLFSSNNQKSKLNLEENYHGSSINDLMEPLSNMQNLSAKSSFLESEFKAPPIFSLSKINLEMTRQVQLAYKFGSIGNEDGQLDKPHGFCIGLNDDIVVADTNNHRICIFDVNGQFKYSFGKCGTESGQLYQPRKVSMLPPFVLKSESEPPVFIVCDRGSRRSRMQVFTLAGKFVRLIDIPFLDIVSGLTTTVDRLIIVVDSVRSGVLVMNQYGDLLNWFSCAPYMIEPSDIALHNRKFYICDFKGHCVAVINEHGYLVQKLTANLLKFPNGIDISNEGDIICGDSHGNRFHISVFKENGELLADYECPFVRVSRCCGLKLTQNGLVVTLAKNNHFVVVLHSISLNESHQNV